MVQQAMNLPSRHVCFVAPFGLGHKTTVWARTLPLAKQLVARGWRATILIPPWDTPQDAGRSWTDAGVALINVATRGGGAAITHRLLRELRRHEPDIVHIVKPRAHAGLVQWWLTTVGAGRGMRLLLDVDDWEQAWEPINHYSWPMARFLAWQEEWGIRHAQAVTAASRWLERRVQEYAPAAQVQYLPNGIDAQQVRVRPWHPPPAGAVLFFTRFVEVAPGWFTEFCTSLHAKRPQTSIVVAGTPVNPGLDEPFRRQIAASPAAAAVEWTGFVPPADLPELYARTGCAIFPAADVPLQQAKCSVRLATTLLQGLPVVASAVGEQAAYGAGGAARLLPAAATPAEFAAAVDEVLQRPSEQIALGAAARGRLVERYSWGRLGQDLFDFYAKILA
ncbi:MAG: glycosyltransferase family 4 protein [Caldilineaceae bacterium]